MAIQGMSARASAPAARAGRPIGTTVFLTVAILLMVLLLAAVSALGNLLIAAMLVASLVAFALMQFPRALFWFGVLGSLVVAGLIELYLPGLQVMRWAFAGATALFFLAMLMRQFGSRSSERRRLDPLLFSALLFLVVCGISTAINWHGTVSAIVGLKNYFQAWGVLLGLAVMSRWEGLERSVTRWMVAIALLQVPFVLHQFLVLAPQRAGMGPMIMPYDVVAGTFGAIFTGGGNNAVMSMFLVMVVSVMMALWRTGVLASRWLWLLPLLLGPVFLNESKVTLVGLILAFVVVFRREIVRRPVRFVGLAIAVAAVVVALLYAYVAEQKTSKVTTPAELIEHFVRQNTQEGERYGTLDLNRTSSLTHWYREQRRYPLAQTLFGHGLSASRENIGVIDTTPNLANTVYPGMGIGITTVSSLLWDVGVVGLISVLALFGVAFFSAGRLARKHASSPTWSGLFQGLQACVAIAALSLIHKNFFVFQLGYQVVVLTLLGYLIYAVKHVPVNPGGGAPGEAKAHEVFA
jgi:hypothetical protein